MLGWDRLLISYLPLSDYLVSFTIRAFYYSTVHIHKIINK